jgi:hypothetical protein
MRIAIAAVATTVALAAAGCGGSTKADEPRPFADIKDCVVDAAPGGGFTASTNPDDMDLVAEDAGLGAVVLSGDNQDVQVVVERSASDAERSAEAYKAFGGTSDNVVVEGNAVIAYSKTPTDTESALVEDCL